MAAEGDAHPKMIREHQSGYDGFIWMMKWGAVLSFIVAMLVMWIIS
ncbi:MAG TPA: aa3-type cytochrome c oxidase subunit IV [Allosphingosinicella sp.]|jgi:hypothetical protein|nr:aa3-type cytochrome c oxidase subunit IV [Allosphingosinicella sp.]